MIKATAASLAGLGLAALAGTALEPAVGRGVLAGVLAAACVGLTGIGLQGRLARSAPEKLMGASVLTFLVQLAVLLAGGLACRYAPSLGSIVDWRGFLVGFAASAFAILVLGSLDVSVALKKALKKGSVP